MMVVYLRRRRKIMLSEGQKGVMILGITKLPQMITIKEASLKTGLPDYFLRKLCITKRIKAIKSGRKYYLNINSLHDFLSKKEGLRNEEVYMEVLRNRDMGAANNYVWNCKIPA